MGDKKAEPHHATGLARELGLVTIGKGQLATRPFRLFSFLPIALSHGSI